jgi:tRNA(Ile)-lysidine synthase
VIRPFLTTSKQQLIAWCEKNSVPWQEDISNYNVKYTRNYIRHNLLPHALQVNPGLNKMIKKKIIDKYSKEQYNNYT